MTENTDSIELESPLIALLGISTLKATWEQWTLNTIGKYRFILEEQLLEELFPAVELVIAAIPGSNEEKQVLTSLLNSLEQNSPTRPSLVWLYNDETEEKTIDQWLKRFTFPLVDMWCLPPSKKIFIKKVSILLNHLEKYNEVFRQNKFLMNQKQLFLRQKAKMENILKSLPFGIIMADSDGNIMLMNRRAKEIIGLNLEDDVLTSGFLRDKISYYPFDLVRGLKDKKGVLLEEELDLPSGKYLSKISLVKDYRGKPLGTLIVFQDLKEGQRYREQAIELIDSVLHEIRTPITTIVTSLELLHKDLMPSISARHARILNLSLNNCNRLIELSTDFLDISKIESGFLDMFLQEMELTMVVEEAVAAFEVSAADKRIDLEVQFTHEHDTVLVDGGRLRQVLNNLLSNAIKFAPEETTVSITTTEMSKNKKQYVCLSVQNFGPPISEKDLVHLFQRFYRTGQAQQKMGSGLGLHISRLIIEALGGEIWAESDEQKGTVFSFTLPQVIK